MPTMKERIVEILRDNDDLTVRGISDIMAGNDRTDYALMSSVGRMLRHLEKDGIAIRTGFEMNAINRPIPTWRLVR